MKSNRWFYLKQSPKTKLNPKNQNWSRQNEMYAQAELYDKYNFTGYYIWVSFLLGWAHLLESVHCQSVRTSVSLTWMIAQVQMQTGYK